MQTQTDIQTNKKKTLKNISNKFNTCIKTRCTTLLGSVSLTCMGHDDNKCSDLASRTVICLQNITGTCSLSIVKTHTSRLNF